MKPRGNYHRNNLKAELLEAGLSLIEEHGHLVVSTRALALRVGVSPGAPYHHFPDRRSLLVALAVRGFEQLNAVASAKLSEAGSPAERLVRIAHGFIEFATAHPRMMQLMYESELTRPVLDPVLAQAYQAGFDLIFSAVQDLLPETIDSTVRLRALSYWSALYGYISLTNKRLISLFITQSATETALAATVAERATAALTWDIQTKAPASLPIARSQKR